MQARFFHMIGLNCRGHIKTDVHAQHAPVGEYAGVPSFDNTLTPDPDPAPLIV